MPDICNRVVWDSAWFGIAIGRVHAASQRLDAAAAVSWAERNDVSCLYALVPSADRDRRAALEQAGFNHVDERLTMRRAIGDLTTDPDDRIRRATATDYEALAQLARMSHHNTRFYVDPHFPRSRCDELYATWILQMTGAADAEVLVATDHGRITGYLSLTGLGSEECRIGLVAVSAAERRQGIGRALMIEGLRTAARHGARHMVVVTQGESAGAVSYYEAGGFQPILSEAWYHWWR
jgi:ribosomal protein S18 acetylase RimI-like enzyme